MTEARAILINGVPYAAVGQGAFLSSRQHQISTVAPPGKPDIRRLIYDAVYRGGAMSRREIAGAVNRKRSPWIESHIERLVADGYLRRRAVPYRSNVSKYLYEVAR